jgi:hypothetical protein
MINVTAPTNLKFGRIEKKQVVDGFAFTNSDKTTVYVAKNNPGDREAYLPGAPYHVRIPVDVYTKKKKGDGYQITESNVSTPFGFTLTWQGPNKPMIEANDCLYPFPEFRPADSANAS